MGKGARQARESGQHLVISRVHGGTNHIVIVCDYITIHTWFQGHYHSQGPQKALARLPVLKENRSTSLCWECTAPLLSGLASPCQCRHFSKDHTAKACRTKFFSKCSRDEACHTSPGLPQPTDQADASTHVSISLVESWLFFLLF